MSASNVIVLLLRGYAYTTLGSNNSAGPNHQAQHEVLEYSAEVEARRQLCSGMKHVKLCPSNGGLGDGGWQPPRSMSPMEGYPHSGRPTLQACGQCCHRCPSTSTICRIQCCTMKIYSVLKYATYQGMVSSWWLHREHVGDYRLVWDSLVRHWEAPHVGSPLVPMEELPVGRVIVLSTQLMDIVPRLIPLVRRCHHLRRPLALVHEAPPFLCHPTKWHKCH